MKKPVALIIMDGYGYTSETKGNAVAAANTPNLDRISKEYPSTLINASGLDVGLPNGQMGNSEVGHTNIGAGRIVYQDLTRITKAIKDGEFFNNEVLCQAMENAKDKALHIMGLLSDGGVHSHIDLTRITKAIKDGEFFNNEVLCQAMENAKDKALHIMGLLSDGGVHSHIDHTRITKAIKDGEFFNNEVLCQAMENAKDKALHIMGLLSDGGVHSHIDHLKALVKMAKEKGVEKVYVHAFTDGRDTDPQSAITYVKEAEEVMAEVGVGEKMAKEKGVEKVYVHAFTDGRDTDPQSAITYVKEAEEVMAEVGVGEFACRGICFCKW